MDGRSARNIRTLLSYLPQKLQDAISSVEMSRARINRVNNSIGHIVSGVYTSTPLVCCGAECPYVRAGRCPLADENLSPVGQDCPLELYLMATWMAEYATALVVEFDNFVEMDSIGTIVNCDIMIYRIRNYMSRSPEGHIDMNTVGIDKGGNVMLARDISKEILIEEKYQRIKDKKLEQLLATRESKAKYDVIDDMNPATRSVRIKELAMTLRGGHRYDAKAKFMSDVNADSDE